MRPRARMRMRIDVHRSLLVRRLWIPAELGSQCKTTMFASARVKIRTFGIEIPSCARQVSCWKDGPSRPAAQAFHFMVSWCRVRRGITLSQRGPVGFQVGEAWHAFGSGRGREPCRVLERNWWSFVIWASCLLSNLPASLLDANLNPPPKIRGPPLGCCY